MTITSLPQTTTVKKPKNLTASDVATTTATLGWTDGEEGLNAWEIAYSTNADFAPDTEETKVSVNANPYTLTGLTPATTYYVYVRAKKGEDYSAWSNKAEFTLLSATPIVTLSTTSHAFGVVSDADAQALSLTISNEGGVALSNLSVTSDNTAFAITDADGNDLANTIAASSSLTVKVKMAAVGQQSGTITISGDDIESQTVTVSGYMADESKIVETFASLPNRWSSGTSWTYNATTGAKAGSYTRTFTTPKIVVAEGESLAVNLKLNYSSGYLKIEGSSDDGETWTAFDAITCNYTNNSLNTSEFNLVTINTIPTGTYKFKLTGEDVYINLFNGFTYAADPVLALYSNETCTSSVAAEVNKNFGFITEQQEQKYYIKNVGTGQIDLTVNTPTGFTAAVNDNALTENEVATLIIGMPAAEGLHNDAIIVTAKNHDTDAVLGTFTVNANGAVAGSKNDINFASLSELPAGWETTGWTVTANNYVGVSGTANDLISQMFTVAEEETLLVEAKGNSSWNAPALTYSYKVGSNDWTDATAIEGVAYSDWKVFAISGIPAGEVKVKFNGTYTNIRRIYGFEAAAVPVMVFTAADKNFGMVNAATTSDAYTITNSGAGVLNDFSVACDNSNFEIAVSDNATSIAANGGTATFTVTLKADVKGVQTGIVTVAGTGVDSKTFTVKGYVVDSEQMFENMTTALPTNWENTSWSISSNAAYASNSSSKLVSPKLAIAQGQKLAISAKLQYNNNFYYVKVEGYNSADNDWTYTKTLSTDVLNNTDFTVVEIDDIPTTVNRIRLVGYYVYVNGIAGFTYDDNDPQFAMYSDDACTAAITATTATNAWGFVSEDKAATYYVKNTGTGTMSLSATDAPAGFTATLGKASLGAGESTSLTIAMANNATTNEGYHAGDVVLTAKDNADNVLGTFTVTSSGVVVSASKADVNFTALSAFPAGWEATNWTVTANEKATIGYSTGTLTTGTYTVTAGESMVIMAKKQSSFSGSLSYQYSTDGGTNWSTAKAITPATTSYELIVISDIPAGDVVIKFTGSYIDIQRIYGYTAVAKANMALDKTSIDFGMQTAAAQQTITITNNGTAEMTGLTVSVATTDYEATIDKATLAVNESATITVTQKFDASRGVASLSDVLTISADGLTDKTVNLSGQTRDGSKWYVDFADNTMPTAFVETGSWSVSSQYASTTSSTETSLITQPVTVAAGEKIQFEAKNPYSGSLKVRYSVNGGISWSEYVDYTSQLNTSAFTALSLDLNNAEAVTAIVDFCGRYYVQLDNIYGGALNNEVPMIAVTKSGTAVESGDTYEFGTISATTEGSYTITNKGNGTLTISTPTTTGGATASVNTTSLTAGQSATLTISMPAEAPYGEKNGTVTVATSLGDFIINYTANILNPNAFAENFDDYSFGSFPEGWSNGAWGVDGKYATVSGTSSDLITPLLKVAGENDVMTFQAAKTSSQSTSTFSVAYSEDGTNWTDVDMSSFTLTATWQDITVKGLEAGNYYLKVSGSRVKVDNFLGWERVPGIVLDETAAPALTEGTTDIILKRSFKAGWNTVCLPFAVSDVATMFGSDASAYKFDSYSNDALNFVKVEDLKAGNPYLVYVASNITKPFVLSSVDVTATTPVDVANTVTFKGSYAPVAAGGLTGKYVVSNTDAKIMKATGSTTMKGFRAYFDNPSGARLSIVLNDDVQGIRTIMAEELNVEGVYNLNGQKVEQLKKGGLYIINGRKQVVK